MMRKIGNSAACRLAKIDRLRRNGDIPRGKYPCAPKAKLGFPRQFDEVDVVGLFLYSHLTQRYQPEKLPKRVASMYACKVMEILRKAGVAADSRIDFPLAAFNDFGLLSKMDEAPKFTVPLGAQDAEAEIATICFRFDIIIPFVREQMAIEIEKAAG